MQRLRELGPKYGLQHWHKGLAQDSSSSFVFTTLIPISMLILIFYDACSSFSAASSSLRLLPSLTAIIISMDVRGPPRGPEVGHS